MACKEIKGKYLSTTHEDDAKGDELIPPQESYRSEALNLTSTLEID